MAVIAVQACYIRQLVGASTPRGVAGRTSAFALGSGSGSFPQALRIRRGPTGSLATHKYAIKRGCEHLLGRGSLRCKGQQDSKVSTETEPPLKTTSASFEVASFVTNGTGLAVSLTVLGVLMLDLLTTGIVASGPDQAIHQWVVTHISTEDRLWWDQTGSNYGIGAGLLLGFPTLVAALLSRKPGNIFKTLRAAVVGQLAYLSCAASVPHDDPIFTKFLKETAHRVRPSDIHATYSFPSGHTTSAAFSAALFVWILLPLVLNGAATDANASEGEEITPEQSQSVFGPGYRNLQIAVFLFLTVETGAGRVFADAHWMSDTVAGAATGFSVVSFAAIVLKTLEQALEQNQTSSSVDVVEGKIAELEEKAAEQATQAETLRNK